MSLIDHIRACNSYDLADFLPFEIDGSRVGWVRRMFAARLAPHRDVFEISRDGLRLKSGLGDAPGRSAAVAPVLARLAESGAIPKLRGEIYPVVPLDLAAGGFAAPALMTMDRAAVVHFGIRAHGVHVNGFVRDGGSIHMWIGTRATDRPNYPGALDNMVAGGQPVGIGLKENVIKEAAEEADVPEALAARARPAGAITYCFETEAGLKPDTLYVYDLEVPADFTPRNTDGEIASFALMPVEEVLEIVAEGEAFKRNCNLVVIDFCIRHGLIGPDRPDYLELVAGLRQGVTGAPPTDIRDMF